METAHNTDDRGLTRSGRPYQRRDRTRTSMERDAVQHQFVGLIAEPNILKLNIATNLTQLHRAMRIAELVHLTQDFERSVKPGKRFSKLGPDVHHLEYRRDHESEEHGVLEVVAQCELMVQHFPPAQQHHNATDNAKNCRRRKG